MPPPSYVAANSSPGRGTGRAGHGLSWWVAGGLILLVFATYHGVGRCGFINLDDDAYVEHQPMVNQGLRWAAVAWAWSAPHSGMWHPVTTLSHMLDCEIFGVRPVPMHWENVAWHALNAVLVFWALRQLTGSRWRSAAVAALFALHPLAVESVVWLAERKNLLSTCFFLIGLGAYGRYARERTRLAFAGVAGAMILSLLAKPMAVTFPALLLLLDYWPLRRGPREGWRVLLWEKVPLLCLALAHSVVTWSAQQSIGAEKFGAQLSLGARCENALVSYARYLGHAVWPDSLSVFHAHPGRWPLAVVVVAAAFVAVATGLAWWQRKRRPWVLVGWLWYAGTLIPVIGLVQVGAQSMADRYTYVPLLGAEVALVWTAAALVGGSRIGRTALAAAFACVLGGLGVLTLRQVKAWESSVSLYERSIAAGGDNATLRYLLALARAQAQRPGAEVVGQFRRALELDPTYTNALTQLAFIEFQSGRFDETESMLRRVLALSGDKAPAHKSLAGFFMQRARWGEAEMELRQAVQLRPSYAEAQFALATLLLSQQRTPEALEHLAAAVRAEPWNPNFRCELGLGCAALRRLDEARAHLERALWIRPEFPRAREALAAVIEMQGRSSGVAR